MEPHGQSHDLAGLGEDGGEQPGGFPAGGGTALGPGAPSPRIHLGAGGARSRHLGGGARRGRRRRRRVGGGRPFRRRELPEVLLGRLEAAERRRRRHRRKAATDSDGRCAMGHGRRWRRGRQAAAIDGHRRRPLGIQERGGASRGTSQRHRRQHRQELRGGARVCSDGCREGVSRRPQALPRRRGREVREVRARPDPRLREGPLPRALGGRR
mmetsp:Transcript_31902/g.91958  ORF Transcript_31902/g.91958 Transcript_31902/m.91958 type:complete len:212 (+) Transcript_31902:1076-1711(+)